MKTKNRGKSPSKVGEDAETRLFEGAIVLAEQIINRNLELSITTMFMMLLRIE